MAGVPESEALALENMAQMTLTGSANDLDPAAIGIRNPLYTAGNLVIETGPSASGVELIVGSVQRAVAPPAVEGSCLLMGTVFTGKGALGTLTDNHILLLRSKVMPGWIRHRSEFMDFKHPGLAQGSQCAVRPLQPTASDRQCEFFPRARFGRSVRPDRPAP
jgi:hypothetical protein